MADSARSARRRALVAASSASASQRRSSRRAASTASSASWSGLGFFGCRSAPGSVSTPPPRTAWPSPPPEAGGREAAMSPDPAARRPKPVGANSSTRTPRARAAPASSSTAAVRSVETSFSCWAALRGRPAACNPSAARAATRSTSSATARPAARSRPASPDSASFWASRRSAPADRRAAMASGWSRAVRFRAQAANVGLRSDLTSAASSLWPAVRSSLARASRAGVNSSSGSP